MSLNLQTDSNYLENAYRYVLVAELIRKGNQLNFPRFDILFSETPDEGYDIVLGCNGKYRFIELKADYGRKRKANVKVSMNLMNRPNGCVVWVLVDPTDLTITNYMFWGADFGLTVPSMIGFNTAKHTKANKDGIKNLRSNIKKIPKSAVTMMPDLESLIRKLFAI